MIFVMPMKAAKMKLAMMAASLQMAFRIPKAVPLQRTEDPLTCGVCVVLYVCVSASAAPEMGGSRAPFVSLRFCNVSFPRV